MKHEKLSAGLMCSMEDFKARGQQALVRRGRSMGIMSVSGVQKPPRLVVFLRCDQGAVFDDYTKIGAVVNESKGSIRTAYLTIPEIEAISDHPGIQRIGSTRTAKPRMNVALPFVHVPQFRTDSQLTGKNVIIGIIDSGIDPNHSDFSGRILRIWDQTLTGPGVVEGNFGLELTGPAMVASRDSDGHGTHVAGIAAGADTTFGGVAPDARIIFVKTDFNTGHIANGIRYVFRVAQEMNLPAVVNLSLGAHFDAHDGSDDLSAIVDQESGQGRIVCCAAGNEGEDNIHAQARITANASTRFRFSIPQQAPGAILNGWYSANDRFEIALQLPNGQQTPFQPIITAGNHTRTFQMGGNDVLISTPGPDPINGDHHFEVQITGSNSPAPTAGVWKLRVRGQSVQNGRVDIWASDFEAGSSIPFLENVSDDIKIGSPGASTQAVTVGSFTTTSSWTDKSGSPRQVDFPLHDISPFSSPGPLRNGDRKPDVSAPGAMIASALSADSDPNPAFILSQTMRMNAGTSMATPFVTGMVALLLQKNPSFTPEEVKVKLKSAASIPQQSPNTFLNDWGFGLVDAARL